MRSIFLRRLGAIAVATVLVSTLYVVGRVVVGGGGGTGSCSTGGSLLDNFNRGNSNPISGSWASLGGVATQLQLKTNAATSATSSSGAGYYTAATYGPDTEVCIDVTALPTTDTWLIAGLYARLTSPGTTSISGYRLFVSNRTATADEWQLYKATANVYTQIGSTVLQNVTAGDRIRFEVIGTTLKGYLYTAGAWTQIISGTDSTYSAAGNIALATRDSSNALLDNFSGGTLGSAPVNSTPPAITGTDQVGLTLTTDSGSWSGSPTGYSYQWQEADDAGFTINVATIGSNSTTYTLVTGNLGKYHRVRVTATNVNGSTIANSNVTGPTIAASSGPSTAHVWVSANGSDTGTNCVRASSLVTIPDASGATVCKTLPKAYALTVPGDQIRMTAAGGDFGTSTIVAGSHAQTAPAVSIGCASGETVLTGFVTFGGSAVPANYVTLDGAGCTWNLNGGFSRSGSVGAPGITGITIKNVHLYATDKGGGHLINFRSLTNSTFGPGLELGPLCCGGNGSGDAMTFTIATTGDPNNASITIDGVFAHDVYDTCLNMPQSVKDVYGCVGTGYGDPSPPGGADHVDCLQVWGVDTMIVKNTRCYAGNPTSANTAGVGQAMFFQAQHGGSFVNLTFQNDMMSCFCGTSMFNMSGPGTSVFSGYLKFLYNTLNSQAISIDDTANRVLAPGTSVYYVGNVMVNHFTHDSASTSCTFIAGDGSTISPVYRNNLWGVGPACDASDIIGSATKVSSNFYTPNLHVGVGGQALCNAGESTYAPTTDIDGESRPQGSGNEIGADESALC